jgi:1-acyl-sn-glycerol-3-phosphate acyltransferase
MDHRIFRVPILSFVFRAMRTIPIASARDDPAVMERAFAEAASALAAGEIVGIFPEGRLTHTGELNRFRPGISRIVQATPVPVIPMALRGLWGSAFSRARKGKAGRSTIGLFSRIALVAAAPVRAEDATPDLLFGRVLALRGDAR